MAKADRRIAAALTLGGLLALLTGLASCGHGSGAGPGPDLSSLFPPPSACAEQTPPPGAAALSAKVRSDAEGLLFELKNERTEAVCLDPPFEGGLPKIVFVVRDPAGAKLVDRYLLEASSDIGLLPPALRAQLVDLDGGQVMERRVDADTFFWGIDMTQPERGFERGVNYPIIFDIMVTYQAHTPTRRPVYEWQEYERASDGKMTKARVVSSQTYGLKGTWVSVQGSCVLRRTETPALGARYPLQIVCS